ncbi:hypothetical protein LVB77_01015 [Lysobacter sp. 5GHs7-4]|uniref:hypothetical protein n=1 Tax=Lysobacter sp. 5GHs7-4 TaxID=2904253 RepID=UPI001E550EAE|nr:hypothetical protein [Lysobacter sp. 5GHs7-4]UHQ23324.1 hypothetical protein LVB77_01015 [Lysobacter sp. 5GHs7-4]
MTYIEHRLIAMVLLSTTMLMACTGSYDRLHERYGHDHDHDADGRKLDVERVTITERNRKGVTSIGDSTSVYLSEEALYLVDKFVYFPGDTRIPATAVDACSMVCFGSRDRHVALVLDEAGAEVTVTDSDQLRRWCWRNRIPAISGSDRRSWLYERKALPTAIVDKSYQTFDRKMRSSCSGY